MPNGSVPAAAPGLPSSRRGFLRGLTALPLIGGSVTLIGQPSAVAEPVTMDLLLEYGMWLEHERYRTAVETYGHPDRVMAHWQTCPAAQWHRQCVDASLPPSTRAALVLSTVGCNWKGGA